MTIPLVSALHDMATGYISWQCPKCQKPSQMHAGRDIPSTYRIQCVCQKCGTNFLVKVAATPPGIKEKVEKPVQTVQPELVEPDPVLDNSLPDISEPVPAPPIKRGRPFVYTPEEYKIVLKERAAKQNAERRKKRELERAQAGIEVISNPEATTPTKPAAPTDAAEKRRLATEKMRSYRARKRASRADIAGQVETPVVPVPVSPASDTRHSITVPRGKNPIIITIIIAEELGTNQV